jgi:hypothetical protein
VAVKGFPNWMVDPSDPNMHAFPFPVADFQYPNDTAGYPQLQSCLSLTFAEYYFTEAVSKTFQNLYDDKNGYQTSFVAFWQQVAQLFKGVDGIIGFES